MDKKIFSFWKKLNPVSAYLSGVRSCAGRVWFPSEKNKKSAVKKIDLLLKDCDSEASKFLKAERLGVLFEEPQDVPGGILSTLYNYFLVEGFNEEHIRLLCESSLKILDLEKYLLDKEWPVELHVFTVLECNGALDVIAAAKENVSDQTKVLLDQLATKINEWKSRFKVQLKDGDFNEIYPQIKGGTLNRKDLYPKLITDFYDHVELPENIAELALGWLRSERSLFQVLCQKLAKKYACDSNPEEVNKKIREQFNVKREDLLETVKLLRVLLQKISEREWVSITKKYKVKLVETPKYLVPFLPTAAMNTFKGLSKRPFCVFFVTTDPKGSPSDSLPDLIQTIVHEEYGHCVNFLNSYTDFVEPVRVLNKLGSSLDTPVTEGISFHRELESLQFFESNANNELTSFVTKFGSYEDFVDAYAFTVHVWRQKRFLRAVCDSWVNTGAKTYVEFLEWAANETGLDKKSIFDQTFFFQENPGYAPCYSLFGMRLKILQEQAMAKGVSRIDFNTFVASIGFPSRTIIEQKIKDKFGL